MNGPSRARLGALTGLIGLIGVSLLTAACGGSSTAKGGGSTGGQPTPTATATQTAAPTATQASAPPTATPHSSGSSCATAAQQTPVLQVVAGASNISGDSLVLDNCALNGNPNAPVIVTPNWTLGGHVYDTSPIGVWYNTANNRWEIYNQTKAAMQSGVGFNVLIAINPETGGGSTYTEQAGIVTISSPSGDNAALPAYVNASELVFAVQDWGVNGNTTYINAPLGVYYYGGSWRVFREDGAAMPSGVSFAVFGITPTPASINHQASASNIAGDYTALNENYAGNQPGANQAAVVFEIPNWSYNSNHVYDTVPTGVWFNGSYWAVFNENNGAMASNTGFNVMFLGQ